jgi:MerR family mercuric resistance operon transcriptional regulator
LAREARIPATTVRYYERIKLLLPDDRSHGNYRLYDVSSLRRLRFIRAAQAIGFTLEDVKALLGNGAGRSSTCREVRDLLEDRLADIEVQLRDLRHVRQVLRKSLQTCKKGDQTGRCHVVEALYRTS